MHRFAPVALATLLAATAPAPLRAQSTAPTPFTVPQPSGHFTDPANLAGERVRPRDGRELPIDGGLSADGKPDNALGLAQMLRRLNTRASLMLIVAHPDDEDGGMLTYYSRGLGARVAILTLNRGEGGQNQMTGDFDDALGLLRTQELLSADRYMGADQMFGTEVDFGFTKTKAEAFQKWNHERVLYDAVRAVRIFRPLIIASTFEGAVTDGHGQHQVSGQIAQEVFKAAGDPNVFPELTKEGILPWQPLKVYARVPFSRVSAQGLYDYATGQTVPAEFTNYVTGQTFTTEPSTDITINEGATDPLLTYASTNLSDLREKPANLNEPLSYVQFARIGLGLQRSQIGGGMRVPRPGRVDASYHLYGSRVCAPNLPNPTPDLCAKASALTETPDNTPGAPPSTRSEASGRVVVPRVVAREKTSSAHLEPTSFTTNPSDNPALTNKNAVILSAGSQPRAAVEEPRESSPSNNTSPVSNPELSHAPSFFDGIDTSWTGIESLDTKDRYSADLLFSMEHEIEAATKHFDTAHPEAVATELADALEDLNKVIKQLAALPGTTDARANLLHELRVKQTQLNNALAFALDLSMQATASSSNLLTQTAASAKVLLSTNSAQPIALTHGWAAGSPNDRVGYDLNNAHPNSSLSKDHPLTDECGLPPTATTVTRPYFRRPNIEQPFYDLIIPELRSAPATPPAFTCWAQLNFQGVGVRIGAVVRHDSQPVQFIPSVDLHVVDGSDLHSVHARVLPNDASFTEVSLFHLPADAKLKSQALADSGAWQTHIAISDVLPPGETRFVIRAPKLPRAPETLTGSATTIEGTKYTEGFRSIGYGTLPRTNYYTPATLRVVPVDLKLPPENKRRIAYLPGTGDDVPAALASIGLTPTILKVSDLTADKLKAFDTVILGVRTYNAHPDLHGAPTQALFDFARNGGNVVVQYQTPEFGAADAPYPLTTHNERVIDETAPVTLLAAGSSKLGAEQDPGAYTLLTTPNKIASADFNGWIEERGHGFLDTWDPHYTALTETHDPGAPAEHIQPQAPQRGGLITVQLGKGRWTYCAFALYRQLPDAVPGAFRLFVNLLNP